MKMVEFTNEEKTKILIKNGWEKSEGYVFNTPISGDYEFHFVEKNEVEEAVKKGSKTWWWDTNNEMIVELEEAWENFTELYWSNEFDDEDDENVVLEALKKFLKEDEE